MRSGNPPLTFGLHSPIRSSGQNSRTIRPPPSLPRTFFRRSRFQVSASLRAAGDHRIAGSFKPNEEKTMQNPRHFVSRRIMLAGIAAAPAFAFAAAPTIARAEDIDAAAARAKATL